MNINAKSLQDLINRSLAAFDAASFADTMREMGVDDMSAEYDEDLDLVIPVIGIQDCVAATFGFIDQPSAEEVAAAAEGLFKMEALYALAS